MEDAERKIKLRVLRATSQPGGETEKKPLYPPGTPARLHRERRQTMRLIDAPVGLLMYDGCLVFKAEYSTAIQAGSGVTHPIATWWRAENIFGVGQKQQKIEII